MKTSPFRFIQLTILILAATIGSYAHAVGPVPAASVPGGVTITDSDDGSGESWGRTGGRDIIYEFSDLSSMSSLYFSPLAVGMAFDGEINAGPEVMGSEIHAGATLRWFGTTEVELAVPAGIHEVQTRFTMTVFAPAAISGPPWEVDLIATAGYMEINILFEASIDGGVTWEPALELYDSLDTLPPPDGDGKAITMFNSGFFFELSAPGMTLEEHDANMQARADEMLAILQFLEIDIPGWHMTLADSIGMNGDKLMQMQIDLQTLLDGTDEGLATSEDIESLRETMFQIQNEIIAQIESMEDDQSLLICLWVGDAFFEVCPDGAEGAPNLLQMATDLALLGEKVDWAKMDISTVLDNMSALSAAMNGRFDGVDSQLETVITNLATTAQPPLELQAAQAPGARDPGPSLLLLSTLGGLGVDASITSVEAVLSPDKATMDVMPLGFVATTLPDDGLQHLELDTTDLPAAVKMLVIRAQAIRDDGSTANGAVLLNSW